MDQCPACGAAIAPGSNFCAACGAALDGDGSREAETAFCRHCGERIAAGAERCPHCGVRVRPAGDEKNPGLAALASFVVPGAGQVYNGQLGKGIALAVGAALSIPLMVFVVGFVTFGAIWIYGVYNAYTTAERINAGDLDSRVYARPGSTVAFDADAGAEAGDGNFDDGTVGVEDTNDGPAEPDR